MIVLCIRPLVFHCWLLLFVITQSWSGCKVLQLACLSVCLLEHLKTTCPDLANFLYVLVVAVARSYSDDTAGRYVLPVLWMMLCFT